MNGNSSKAIHQSKHVIVSMPCPFSDLDAQQWFHSMNLSTHQLQAVAQASNQMLCSLSVYLNLKCVAVFAGYIL